MKNIILLFCISLFVLSCATTPKVPTKNPNKELPAGFVFLADIDPTIIQSPRYFGSDNFLGRPVPGYNSPQIVVTQATAEGLKTVQADLKTQGYQLVVYDGYRPQRAVDAFMNWSKDLSDQKVKNLYYPTVNKKDVFRLNYIAERSGHSRGSTVDLSLLPLNHKLHSLQLSQKQLSNGEMIPFLDDGSVDMGSSFDLFHPASHHDSNLVSVTVTQKRNFLRDIMKKHGFKDYHEEWWHYTLVNEPYPEQYFDFTY